MAGLVLAVALVGSGAQAAPRAFAPPFAPLEQGDVLAQARALAEAARRTEALQLLRDRLVAAPDDADARVLFGAILSWEGHHDEARSELQLVLDRRPGRGDALAALINVELWSDHPDRAERLARQALAQKPGDADLMLALARALVALGRDDEARETVGQVLAADPQHAQARQLDRRLSERALNWQVSFHYAYDQFSDRRAAWREAQVSVRRDTPVGSVLVRGLKAERFGLQDEQVEVEAYPKFRKGSYAYVSAAFSPEAVLYPSYRFALDLYQSLGAGFEGAIGYRQLGFSRTVNIYVGALSKYYGNWLFTGRTFITPNAFGVSRSFHGSARRYFGDGIAYVGVRYGRGTSREEIRNLNDLEVLDSDTVAAEANVPLGRRVELTVRSSYSREERVGRRDLRQYSTSAVLGLKF